MLGAILAMGSAAAFGANSLISRRGAVRVNADYVATISIFSGPVFFLIICVINGEIFNLWQFPWRAYALFAVSGIIHFAFGRTFAYRSNLLLGVTRSNIVTGLSTIVTVVLAAIVLQESITPIMAVGIVLSMSGPSLLTLKERTAVAGNNATASVGGKEIDRATLHEGVLLGLGAAVFWGTSPILVKMGIDNGGSPVAGSLIAYVAASLAISYSLLDAEKRRELSSSGSEAFQLALWSGMTSNTAQLLRFVALAYAPAITVSLMLRTAPLWVLLLAFLFQRRNESFSRWVFVGNSLLLAGTVLALV